MRLLASIIKSYSFLEKNLLANVLLSGGSTMFDGLEHRLSKSLNEKFSNTKNIKVIAPPERKYSVWIGISILSSLSNFQRLWMIKDEYDEYGPKFIEFKCPSTFSESKEF